MPSAFQNNVIRLIARSPLHSLVSKATVLLTYNGVKTGTEYTIPVNYIYEDNDHLLILSHTHRTWWRNFRGGAPVTVRLAGRDFDAEAEAIEEPEALRAALLTMLRKFGAYQRIFEMYLDSEGEPLRPEVFDAFVQTKVAVRVSLPSSE